MNKENGSAANLNYELFFELSPDLLCIAGYDGFFKKINNAVSQALGYSLEELYAKPINDFVYHDDKDITSGVREQLTQHKPLHNFENRYLTKSGEIIWLSWTSFPVESERLIFAIAKDISHKKRLESDRNILLTNLTNINDDLKQMTYTTAHDLRSPVNNLLSTFDMIDVSKISDPETLEFIEILKLSGESLKESLNKYVDLLSTKNSLHVDMEEVDLNDCLKLVLSSINSLIEISKTTIHINFDEVAKVIFNKSHLESIFLNLITNAIKYSKPHCLPIISISSATVNGTNQLIITDNGIGFDMEKVEGKIFGLQQKFSDNKDSKGIGLYLVHNHVIRSGGKINVKSAVNQGTTFTISFKN